jgi:hypothetical protein
MSNFPPAPEFPSARIADIPNEKLLNYPPAPPMFGNLSGANGVSLYPFSVLIASSTTFTLRPGTINGFTPSNIGSTFTMTGSGTEYVVLDVTMTNAVVTGATIRTPTPTIAPAAMPVVNGSPPSSFAVLLAVLVSGKPFRTIGNGSLTATPFEAYRLERAMLTPDSLPYDSYYSWRTGTT